MHYRSVFSYLWTGLFTPHTLHTYHTTATPALYAPSTPHSLPPHTPTTPCVPVVPLGRTLVYAVLDIYNWPLNVHHYRTYRIVTWMPPPLQPPPLPTVLPHSPPHTVPSSCVTTCTAPGLFLILPSPVRIPPPPHTRCCHFTTYYAYTRSSHYPYRDYPLPHHHAPPPPAATPHTPHTPPHFPLPAPPPPPVTLPRLHLWTRGSARRTVPRTFATPARTEWLHTHTHIPGCWLCYIYTHCTCLGLFTRWDSQLCPTTCMPYPSRYVVIWYTIPLLSIVIVIVVLDHALQFTARGCAVLHHLCYATASQPAYNARYAFAFSPLPDADARTLVPNALRCGRGRALRLPVRCCRHWFCRGSVWFPFRAPPPVAVRYASTRLSWRACNTYHLLLPTLRHRWLGAGALLAPYGYGSVRCCLTTGLFFRVMRFNAVLDCNTARLLRLYCRCLSPHTHTCTPHIPFLG